MKKSKSKKLVFLCLIFLGLSSSSLAQSQCKAECSVIDNLVEGVKEQVTDFKAGDTQCVIVGGKDNGGNTQVGILGCETKGDRHGQDKSESSLTIGLGVRFTFGKEPEKKSHNEGTRERINPKW